jgi:anti-sigma-K factor RskA
MADDVHELSALYALDVLSDDERAQFEQHLEDCGRCRAEIDGLRTAGSSLAFAVEGPPPPAELRARVLAGELVVAPSGDAVLSVQLPKPLEGKTYEAWVADPSVHPAGVFAGRTTKLRVRVHRSAQVTVSVEPAGGVDAPTTTPIVSARA